MRQKTALSPTRPAACRSAVVTALGGLLSIALLLMADVSLAMNGSRTTLAPSLPATPTSQLGEVSQSFLTLSPAPPLASAPGLGSYGLESVDLGLRLRRPWAAQVFAGVGMASFASFSYLEGEADGAAEHNPELCDDGVCQPQAEPDPSEKHRQQQRQLLRNISLGLGIAALSGALWFTVSHDPAPGGHTTRLGFRPVSGGSVCLIGGRF